MTSARTFLLLLAPTLVGSSFLAYRPASAEAADDARAVAQCRAEVLRHVPAETIRNQRIASITGNGRRTRVEMFVTTDRRYSFQCTADAEGRVVTAAWNPPVDRRVAAAPGDARAR
ncbi:MAG TPA: hypothetical protein VMG08_21395 [Allosphingosinicella sp.]|nr:hypothetical protein [Allosphingosinicella sp.]